MQEIKFEPNVMCEHIDKKSTFKASQVSLQPLLLRSMMSTDIKCSSAMFWRLSDSVMLTTV